jgi:Ca2+-binding RTX toxin-like protein
VRQSRDDVLNGGMGDDLFLVGGAGEGFDAIDGGAGFDTIKATADGTVIGLSSLTGIEAISAGGYAGVSIVGTATAQNWDFTSISLTGVVRIDAGASNDTVTGSVGADTLVGGAGNDLLSGGAGDDLFLVGPGDGTDSIDGGAGTDTIRATADGTVIGLSNFTGIEAFSAGGYAGVSITGTASVQVWNFTSMNLTGITRIDAGAGNDTITGSVGADTLVGGAGDDVLTGGLGDDLFLVGGAGEGFDAIDGGAGFDTIKATADGAVIGLGSLTGIEAISVGGYAGVSIVGTATAQNWDFTSISLTGIARIDGGAGNDTIVGNVEANVIAGGAGADLLDGGAGSDTVTYANAASGVSVNLSSGVNIGGDAQGDQLIGFENVVGSAYADTLTGDAQANLLTGNAGKDTLVGGAGADTLDGGAGSDTASYFGSAAGVTVNLAAGSVSGGDADGDVLIGIENLTGSAYADLLTGDAGANTLSGGGRRRHVGWGRRKRHADRRRWA